MDVFSIIHVGFVHIWLESLWYSLSLGEKQYEHNLENHDV